MSIIQISKIQVRTGNLIDLPQLSAGEFGWADDERRLFIGNDSNRVGDPDPNNTEILTKYSPIELSGNVTIANVEDFHIGGGNNGYFLQTNGNGVLVWSAVPSSSNSAIAGSTNQLQYNNAGSFNASANLQFFAANNTLDINGNVKSANLSVNVYAEFSNALFTGNVTVGNANGTIQNAFILLGDANANVSNIGLGSGQIFADRITVQQANVNANIISNTITANTLLRAANSLQVNDGSGSNTAGILIVGNSNVVANAAGITLTGYVNAQGNITGNVFTGNILNISTSANIDNVIIANSNIEAANITSNGGVFTGNGSGLSAISASNLSSGTVPSGRLSGSYGISVTSANTAATVTTAAQPNITSVGTLTSLNVGDITSTGEVSANTLDISNGANVTGTLAVTGNATVSSNVTILGNVTASSATFVNTVIATTFIGNFVSPIIQQGNSNILVQSNGDIRMTSNGQADILVIQSNGLTSTTTIANNLSVIQTVTANNFSGPLSNGTSNVSVASNANIVLTANGNNIANFTSTSANIFGNLTVTSNITAGALIAPLANGNSNVSIPAVNGNVNISAIGVANVLVVSNTGVNVSGILTSSGNLTATNANAGNLLTANYISGVLVTAAQPNITSIGNLIDLNISNSLTVSANITANKVNAGNGFFGQLQTSNQSLITQVGQLGNLTVGNGVTVTQLYANGDALFSGNVAFSANIQTGGFIFGTFDANSNSQPNIRSVGNLTSLTVDGNLNGNVANVVDFIATNSFSLGNAVTWNANSNVLTSNSLLATYGNIPNLTYTASISEASVSPNAVPSTGNINVAASTLYLWQGASTANFQLNITNVSSVLSSNRALNVTAVLKNPLSIGYVASNVKIDGTNANVNWIGGAPTPQTGGYDVYNFNILQTAANTYFVLGKRDTTS